jgi:hypothetical protein
MVHRRNNEFTSTAIKESNVTVAAQKKSKKDRMVVATTAVKERAMEELEHMRRNSPTKKEDRRIKRAVAKEHLRRSKVKRVKERVEINGKHAETVNLKLQMLKANMDAYSSEEYDRRRKELLEELFQDPTDKLSESENEDLIDKSSDEEVQDTMEEEDEEQNEDED